jgi:Raf kinase inhibitor-like YbhB/YbcL family protein
MRVASTAFTAGGTIPKAFTCEGDDISPPLTWSAPPTAAKGLVLLVEDPDAPSGTFVHWAVFSIPRSVRSSPKGGTPPGAEEGKNSFGKTGYRGPCPPKGDDPHRYRFIVYAVSQPAKLTANTAPDAVHKAINQAHPLARGVLQARFSR